MNSDMKIRKDFNIGMSFDNAADVLQKLALGNSGKPEHGSLLFPVIVNRAFACEMFLKAIYYGETGYPHMNRPNKPKSQRSGIHHLGNIFDDLSTKTKQAIIHNMNLPTDQFISELGKISNAFVNWRYADTELSISVSFIQQLNLALISVGKPIVENSATELLIS